MKNIEPDILEEVEKYSGKGYKMIFHHEMDGTHIFCTVSSRHMLFLRIFRTMSGVALTSVDRKIEIDNLKNYKPDEELCDSDY